MKDKKSTKKQKIIKFLGISSVIISLVLSSMALYYVSENNDTKSGENGETTLSRTGQLYGTNGCENGGFSIQFGIDSNEDGVLNDEEVSEIKNVCNGAEGPPGPMGNKGYTGPNGTDGIDGLNGSNGEIGVSSFIGSYVGEYASCPQAAIIEMGNNSTSGVVESSIKICFENLSSGRLTEINQNIGDSFSSGCNGGYAHQEMFLFAAARDGKCLLYKIENSEVVLLSDEINFSPGSILGFSWHDGRFWFDANDSTGVQLWSSDGFSLSRETNLSTPIQQGDQLIILGEEIVLRHQNGMIFFADSDVFFQGTFTNLTVANQNLIYNTANGIFLEGSLLSGEIHSSATYHQGYYWFIATSDTFGPQLHRANSFGLERMTDSLQNMPGQIISPTVSSGNVLFDSSGLFAFNTSSLTLSHLNTSITNIPQNSDWIYHQDKLWFQCGIPGIGYELCASDGKDAWLHYDFVPGMDSSNPEHLTLIGDNLVAIIDDQIQGGQLVIINDQDMELLWDHSPGGFDSGSHGQLWVAKDWVFFIADDANTGLEMYGWAHGELSDEWIIIH